MSLRGRDTLELFSPILDDYDLRHRHRRLLALLIHKDVAAARRDIVRP